jgi:hypothetical protein
MITLLRELSCVTFFDSMRYYSFNLIFTCTLSRSLRGINYEFSHVGFVSLNAIKSPIGKITLVVFFIKKIILSFPPSNQTSCLIKH